MRRGAEPEAFAPIITFGSETAGPLPFDGPSEASAEEAEPMRRSLLRAGMTVLWMILLAAGYAWRACSQN